MGRVDAQGIGDKVAYLAHNHQGHARPPEGVFEVTIALAGLLVVLCVGLEQAHLLEDEGDADEEARGDGQRDADGLVDRRSTVCTHGAARARAVRMRSPSWCVVVRRSTASGGRRGSVRAKGRLLQMEAISSIPWRLVLSLPVHNGLNNAGVSQWRSLAWVWPCVAGAADKARAVQRKTSEGETAIGQWAQVRVFARYGRREVRLKEEEGSGAA